MNKKRIYIILSFFAIIGTMTAAYSLYEHFTGDFRAINISFDPPHNSQLDIASLTPDQRAELDKALDQPYTWLDHGHQVFAFLSQDQKYVLKIFKFKRLKPSVINGWLAYIPGLKHHFEEREGKRVRRLAKLFTGYHLAYTQDREHSGLLFIHLNKSNNLNKNVEITDRMGFSHQVNLDDVFFAIQEKGRVTQDVLVGLLDNGDVESVSRHIALLFDMYVAEYRKGIVDWDHNIMHNTGFVGERPVRLDLGQLQHDETVKDVNVFKQDLMKISSKRFTGWLQSHYPDVEPAITADIAQKLAEYE